MKIKKPLIMRCRNCKHFIKTQFCNLFRKFADETGYCTEYNADMDETQALDPGSDTEIGFDVDLKEVETLDGDDESTWTAEVDWSGK